MVGSYPDSNKGLQLIIYIYRLLLLGMAEIQQQHTTCCDHDLCLGIGEYMLNLYIIHVHNAEMLSVLCWVGDWYHVCFHFVRWCMSCQSIVNTVSGCSSLFHVFIMLIHIDLVSAKTNKKLSYCKQIARQLRTQYVESTYAYSNSVTLKLRGHWKS